MSWAFSADAPSLLSPKLLAQAGVPQTNQAQPAPPAPPAAPAPPGTPDWPTLSQLLKLPPWMDLTLSVTVAPITNPVGGLTSAANWMQLNELNLTLGSGLNRDPSTWTRELDRWQAKVRLDVYNGQDDYGSVIGSFFAPQTIAYPAGFYLSGASLMRTSADGALQIGLGFQSLDQDFLVNPAYNSYLFSGFNNTLNLTLPGLPISPFAGLSALVHWKTQALGTWSAGVYLLDQETEMGGLLGAPPATAADLGGSLQVLQWDLPLWQHNTALQNPIKLANGGAVPRQLPAPLLQLGAFNTSVNFQDLSDSPTGATPLANQVVYSSLTLPVSLPIGLDNRLWGGLQWGLNEDQNPTPVFLQGGWLCQGIFPGRPQDVLALGIGRTGFSPQIDPQLDWSGALELNYSIRINSNLAIQPVVQWLMRPSGDGQVPGILTTALQVTLNF